MARSIYFSERSKSEQSLYEDIVIEALKIYGYDMYYLPRDVIKTNDLLNEDPSSRFNSSYMIEMYVDNIEGFDGQGDLFTKFGVEIRDNVTLTVSRRRWAQAIKRYDNEITSERPLEGDLIYVPFSRKLFQIMKVEHELPFYQLANLPTYKLQCELYEYSGDDFDTSVTVIDEIERTYAYKYILEFQAEENATATSSLDSNGGVNEITLTGTGVGYTSTPEVTVAAPTSSARTASITLSTNNDNIIGYTINDGGNFYTSTPTITFPTPTPIGRFRFGDRALYHDSAGKSTFAETSAYTNSVVGNRTAIKFWYWAEQRNPDHAVLITTPRYLVYHRSSDDKIIMKSSVGQAISSSSVIVYDAEADSGYWNFIELHLLDNSVKIILNTHDGDPGTLGDAIGRQFGDTQYFGGRVDNTVDSNLTDGFVGYIDHLVSIVTGDDAFRDPDPKPINTSQQELDGDTLVRAQSVITFNNQVPDGYVTVNPGGYIESLTLSNVGQGFPDSSYTLTISAPTGVANDFRATAIAEMDSDFADQVRNVYVENKGGGYTSPPAVTINPQGIDLTFYPGEIVYQQLANDVVLTAEVAKYSDSDYKLHLINVSASDGKYHEFLTDEFIRRDSAAGPLSAKVLRISEELQSSSTEQNDLFGTEADVFLDFSETNPFGSPGSN